MKRNVLVWIVLVVERWKVWGFWFWRCFARLEGAEIFTRARAIKFLWRRTRLTPRHGSKSAFKAFSSTATLYDFRSDRRLSRMENSASDKFLSKLHQKLDFHELSSKQDVSKFS